MVIVVIRLLKDRINMSAYLGDGIVYAVSTI